MPSSAASACLTALGRPRRPACTTPAAFRPLTHIHLHHASLQAHAMSLWTTWSSPWRPEQLDNLPHTSSALKSQHPTSAMCRRRCWAARSQPVWQLRAGAGAWGAPFRCAPHSQHPTSAHDVQAEVLGSAVSAFLATLGRRRGLGCTSLDPATDAQTTSGDPGISLDLEGGVRGAAPPLSGPGSPEPELQVRRRLLCSTPGHVHLIRRGSCGCMCVRSFAVTLHLSSLPPLLSLTFFSLSILSSSLSCGGAKP